MKDIKDRIKVGIVSMCNHGLTDKCIKSCIKSGINDVYVFCNSSTINFDNSVRHDIAGRNIGVSYGWNMLVKDFLKSDKDYLFICNDDIIFMNNWHICAKHLDDERIGIVSPLLLERKFYDDISGSSNIFLNDWQNVCLFGCFGINRKTIEKIGMFDEEFECCGEDSDYKARIFKYALSSENPILMMTDNSCYVFHYGGQSLKSSFNETREKSKMANILFDRKHPEWPTLTRANYDRVSIEYGKKLECVKNGIE